MKRRRAHSTTKIGNFGELFASAYLDGEFKDSNSNNPLPRGSVPDLTLISNDLVEVKMAQIRLVLKLQQFMRFLRYQYDSKQTSTSELSLFVIKHHLNNPFRQKPIPLLYKQLTMSTDFCITLPFSLALKLTFLSANEENIYLQHNQNVVANTQVRTTLLRRLGTDFYSTLDKINSLESTLLPELNIEAYTLEEEHTPRITLQYNKRNKLSISPKIHYHIQDSSNIQYCKQAYSILKQHYPVPEFV